MNKTLIAIIAGVFILGGGAAYVASNNSADEPTNSENSSTSAEVAAMEAKKLEEAAMEKKDGNGEETAKDSSSTSNSARFVTLSDFDSNKASYNDNTKVYFFHASWCSICKGIEEEIVSDVNKIPEGTTFIKTDFDSQTELRQKYGVTNQYTFVQVDNTGNLIKKWSATNLEKAIAGIQQS